jgi:beta-glucanase (GH16 family)
MKSALFALLVFTSVGPVQAETSSLAEDKWSLVWSDEFVGDGINPQKWQHEVNCWGGGNQEQQCYTDKPENSSVANGLLTITARKEITHGPALPVDQRKTPADFKNTASKAYSSARLTTQGLADWRFGRIAIRAKLPEGQGIWPAIWMLPIENHYGAWAASGEIDIMEAANLGTPCKKCAGGRENHVLGTLQFGGVWPKNTFASQETELVPTKDGFHVFEIMWTADRIDWAIDGIAYATAPASSWFSGIPGQNSKGAPFDRSFYLILNLAVGGRLAEGRNMKGISNKGFPSQFQVDWVRVYQCAGVAKGRAKCAT